MVGNLHERLQNFDTQGSPHISGILFTIKSHKEVSKSSHFSARALVINSNSITTGMYKSTEHVYIIRGKNFLLNWLIIMGKI
jgi:hypothetical protein